MITDQVRFYAQLASLAVIGVLAGWLALVQNDLVDARKLLVARQARITDLEAAAKARVAAIDQLQGANDRMAAAIAEQNRRIADQARAARSLEAAAAANDQVVAAATAERKRAAAARQASGQRPSPEAMANIIGAALGAQP